MQPIDNTRLLINVLHELSAKQCYVGIPADSEKNSRDDAEITNSEIGFKNEFGSPQENIPARAHLLPGVSDASDKIADILQKAAARALSLRVDSSQALDNGLNAAGLVAVASVKKKITDVLSPALAELTLSERRRRGHDGETPLIETGSYIGSINYIVE